MWKRHVTERLATAMEKHHFEPETDGFHGVYYPRPGGADRALVAMIGDDCEDRLAVCAVRYLHELGVNVMCMSPATRDYGHHGYPLERFGAALDELRRRGNVKFGVAGASTTGMLALLAASYYPDFTLTVAFTPCDFVMEGFYQGKRDGCREWPGKGESTVTWRGEQLPYLPYAYRHPEYWRAVKRESKETGNFISSRGLFEESMRRHPLREAELIKVERAHGRVILVGAEDDALWDTCGSIRRMQARLAERPHECSCEAWLYEHGSHFVFPQTLAAKMIPLVSGLAIRLCFRAARDHGAACKATRVDVDNRLRRAVAEW